MSILRLKEITQYVIVNLPNYTASHPRRP